MALALNRFASGDTDYIPKHNQNASRTEAAVNQNKTDIEAVKSALNAGADQDYRENALNMCHNSNFEIWQRAARPDRWIISPASADVTQDVSEIYIGANSLKLAEIATVYQRWLAEDIDKLVQKNLCFAAWGKTATEDACRLAINVDSVEQYSDYFPNTDTWTQRFVTHYFDTPPTTINLEIINEKNVDVYVSGAILVFGNPAAGPIYNYNYLEDYQNCLRFYEESLVTMIGAGYAVGGNQQLGAFIKFCKEKYAIPDVDIIDIETGFAYEIGTINRCGFTLIVTSSDANGVNVEDIEYSAEVEGY